MSSLRPPTRDWTSSARGCGKAIDQLLESGFYFEVSDYLRHIIKKDLEERGLLPEPKVKAEPEEDG